MKLLLVCNPGGHYSTMMGLKKFWATHDREWVTYRKYDTLNLRGKEIVHWVMMQEASNDRPCPGKFFRGISNFVES